MKVEHATDRVLVRELGLVMGAAEGPALMATVKVMVDDGAVSVIVSVGRDQGLPVLELAENLMRLVHAGQVRAIAELYGPDVAQGLMAMATQEAGVEP